MRKENACPDFKVENFRCKLLKKTAANKAEVINFIFREEKKARQASHVIVQSALRFPPESQFGFQWEFCLYYVWWLQALAGSTSSPIGLNAIGITQKRFATPP